jgi:hypothetical protein
MVRVYGAHPTQPAREAVLLPAAPPYPAFQAAAARGVGAWPADGGREGEVLVRGTGGVHLACTTRCCGTPRKELVRRACRLVHAYACCV